MKKDNSRYNWQGSPIDDTIGQGGRTHMFNTSIGRNSANEDVRIVRDETPLGQRDKRRKI